MRPSTAPAGAVVSNTLKAPGLGLKPATASPISKAFVPAVRLMFCARVLVAAALTSVVEFQSTPS